MDNSQKTALKKTQRAKWLLYLAILVVLTTAVLVFIQSRHTNTTATNKTGCVTQSFAEGSSSACVSDAKNMINYIENSGLNECPFDGGKILHISDSYDTATTQQVTVIQKWTNCYNKQERSNERLSVDGKIDSATWNTLCSYGFTFADRSQSSTSTYRTAAITAGKNAGCE